MGTLISRHSTLKADLVSYSLKRRFVFMGVLNAIFAPFIVIYLLIYSFFRYFEVGPPANTLAL
jgi:hypothetical protein